MDGVWRIGCEGFEKPMGLVGDVHKDARAIFGSSQPHHRVQAVSSAMSIIDALVQIPTVVIYALKRTLASVTDSSTPLLPFVPKSSEFGRPRA